MSGFHGDNTQDGGKIFLPLNPSSNAGPNTTLVDVPMYEHFRI